MEKKYCAIKALKVKFQNLKYTDIYQHKRYDL